MNQDERKMLCLFTEHGDRDCVYYFRFFEKHMGISYKEVRKIMHSLRDLGYVEFVRGLMGEEGVAGSGYGLTSLGSSTIDLLESGEYDGVKA